MIPKPTKCPNCGFVAAAVVCSLCGTLRPAYAQAKVISQAQRRLNNRMRTAMKG